jgi:pantetheine-phosphate adenylyltransferase
MTKLLYSGSFDPITHGHIEIIKRARNLCDELYIGVGINAQKRYMFTMEERISMVKEWSSHMLGITVVEIDGLTADKAIELGCTGLVRGVRTGSDFDREMQIAQINQELYYLDTVFLPAVDFGFISSSAVKELAMLGANEYQLGKFVPSTVAKALEAKIHTMHVNATLRT